MAAKKCDLCHKNDAVMKVRRVDKNGKASEIEVCAECASARGFTEGEKLKMDAAHVLAEMKSSKVGAEDKQLVCSRCGLTYARFKRSGRLGCAGCYESFKEKIEPLIRRLHNSVQHVGKTPSSGRTEAQRKLSAQRISTELSQAIQQEDYEKAARLRDQLKQAGEDA